MKKAKNNYPNRLLGSYGQPLSGSFRLRRMEQPELVEACTWGIVSGGFSCFYIGGTFHEEYEGEKLAKLKPIYEEYKKQISDL